MSIFTYSGLVFSCLPLGRNTNPKKPFAMTHKHLLAAIAALTLVSAAYAQPGRKTTTNQQQTTTQQQTTQQQSTATQQSTGKSVGRRIPVKKDRTTTTVNTGARPSTSVSNTNEGSSRGGIKGRTTSSSTAAASSTSAAASNTSAADADKARRKAINDYLLNNMSQLENPKALTRSIPANNVPPYIQQGNSIYELKVERHNVNDADHDIFTEDNTKIFPGVLLVANKSLADGDPQVVAGLGIGRVDIALDIDTGGDKFKMENVPMTFADVQKAYSTLVRQLYSSGYKQPGRIKSITSDYSSTEEIAIKAGCDLKFAAQFSASVSTNSTSSTITHLDDLSQVYYNVVVTPHNGDYSNLFGPEVTVQDIMNAVKRYNNSPFVFVNQMTFGRRLYKFTDYKSSDFKMSASESGSYSGASFSSTQDIKKNTKSSSVKVYIRGGDPSLGSGLIQDDATVKSVLDKYSGGSNDPMTMSKANQGISMSYMTTYLGSQQTCKRSTVGVYYTQEYKKCPTYVEVTFRNNLSHIAGAEFKMRIDFKISHFEGNRKVSRKPEKGVEDGYTNWEEYNMGFGKKKTFIIDLKPGEFIDGYMRLQLRNKETTYRDWYNSVVCKVLPTESGIIDVDARGHLGPTNVTSGYIYSKSVTQSLGKTQ